MLRAAPSEVRFAVHPGFHLAEGAALDTMALPDEQRYGVWLSADNREYLILVNGRAADPILWIFAHVGLLALTTRRPLTVLRVAGFS